MGMDKLTKLGKWLPVIWVGPAAVILVADYFTGPLISFLSLFVIPVALAARLRGRRWGIGLGTLMPLCHFGFTFLWQRARTAVDSLINAGVRMAVLVTVAVIVDHITRQAREIRVLNGAAAGLLRLPEDSHRRPALATNGGLYHQTFEAKFSHTFCPECAKKQYPEVYGKGEVERGSAAGGAGSRAA